MVLLRVLLPCLLCASVGAQSPSLEPYELPVDVAAAVRELTGAEPMRLLELLGDPTRQAREPAVEHWGQLDVRAQCALVRAGLRAGGSAAVGAAALAGEGDWLDLAETKAAVRAALPTCNRVDTPFDLGALFRMFDSEDAAAFLGNPGPRPREVPQFLGSMHRVLGPEHYPLIERLARSDDLLLRIEAVQYLGGRRIHRERIADFVITQPPGWKDEPEGVDIYSQPVPYVPLAVPSSAAREGYPAKLAALLERTFLRGGEGPPGSQFVAFHWVGEANAGPDDQTLLLQLAACNADAARRIAVHGLAQLGSPAALDALRRIAADRAEGRIAPACALGALVRSGDAEAKAALAADDAPDLALAVLWSVARADAERRLDAAFAGGGADSMASFWRLLEQAHRGASCGMPMDGLGEALVLRARRMDPDARRLFAMLEQWSATRRPDLLARAIALLDVANVVHAPLAVLEVADPVALATALHRIVRESKDHGDSIRRALPALVRMEPSLLGDAEDVLALFGRAESWDWQEEREELRIRLAAARPEVLRDRVLAALRREHGAGTWSGAGAMAAAAAVGGVDVHLALSLRNAYGERNTTPAEFEAAMAVMREPLLRGDGVAAVEALLAAADGSLCGLDGLWTLRDGRGLPYLRAARDRRELGGHREAIGQLARAGDPAALATVEHAIRARLYGWMDSWSPHVLANGHDLARVPLLVAQLDTNCCTHTVVSGALQQIVPLVPEPADDLAVPRVERERAFWQVAREQLRFSRIADGHVVLPARDR